MARSSSDIVVVGAGIVGCAVAHELARRGASVQVVEQRAIGMGATHASAGILAPYIEAGTDETLLDLTVRSLGLFDNFIARVVAESGVPVPYHRTGTLQVALNDEEMLELRHAAARLEAEHVAASVLDAQAARTAEPHLSDAVVGALVVSTHGFTAAGDLTRALAAAACRHGARLIEASAVGRIVPKNGDLIVDTDRGAFIGGAVVLAAGSWSGQIEIVGVPARVPVRPVRGQLLRLAWRGSAVRRVTWRGRCYLVPWDDGTLLVGATVEDVGFEECTTVAGVRDLLEAACELAPQAWKAGLAGAYAGLRPKSADELPVIGASRVVPNLMYATGHYRNGILLAPLTAELVADAMLDGRMDPALAAISPQRFGDL
ncbi:MAG: glycine oxidase ThiO [Acidobacteria bacterium RIFCSPLOWO2_02_FULL_64_15]|nr:MAG: glycine oxidase ThiO [Acidobacteria bacterium RIFCSPLOWO2_02_FULL_64_15]